MSQNPRKKISIGVNTDSFSFDIGKPVIDKPKRISFKLKERNITHVRVSNSGEIKEIYSFGDIIGQGGFGKVIAIKDKGTDTNWAMKIVSKAAVGNKIEIINREIQILKMVDHPHIIYLDKVYESVKKIYMILERCYGTLSSIYEEVKRFSEQDTKIIVRDLISAVSYLHKNDIVHRDLKLENILIAKNPYDDQDHLYIKITDFGLSIVKKGSGHEDMLHDCCGTLMYMAPEVVTKRSYSQQCDVWAVGVIMYALLAGQYPFDSKNERDLMKMIRRDDPTFSNFDSTQEARNLISKMLDKNPALRITAAEIINHPWLMGTTGRDGCCENVLDMMRLWRSEMMLPVGDECDWVTSAKAAGSSPGILSNSSSVVKIGPPRQQEFSIASSSHNKSNDLKGSNASADKRGPRESSVKDRVVCADVSKPQARFEACYELHTSERSISSNKMLTPPNTPTQNVRTENLHLGIPIITHKVSRSQLAKRAGK